MKSSAKKIELASVDDLFSTEESRQDEQLEKIQEIPLSELHPFKDHPFKVKDDDAMIETADSIKKYGVLVPAIARPLPDGSYELVCRRTHYLDLFGTNPVGQSYMAVPQQNTRPRSKPCKIRCSGMMMLLDFILSGMLSTATSTKALPELRSINGMPLCR